MSSENSIEFLNSISNIDFGHYPNALCFQDYNTNLAEHELASGNEIKALYHLVESHGSHQRHALNEIDKLREEKATLLKPLNFSCFDANSHETKSLLEQIKDLPKEWTILQLSSVTCIEQYANRCPDKYYTNPLILSVFNCGSCADDPIVISIKAPINRSGEIINLASKLHQILKDFHILYDEKVYKKNSRLQQGKHPERTLYLDNQMKICLYSISLDWLREWKCFFIGSYVAEEMNLLVLECLEKLLKKYQLDDIPVRSKTILKYLFKAASYLTTVELKRALKSCISIPLDSSSAAFCKEFVEKSNSLSCNHLPRNPLILILDEKLEIFPWEMLAVIELQPVTRMPSFHVTRALYQQYKDRIVNGYLTGLNPDRGTYLINPGRDLPSMEARMGAFMTYWMPQWRGVTGRSPTEPEFEDLLKETDIFVYNGHGDGCQFLSGDRIKNLNISSVVFLFGCSSVGYRSAGPRCSLYSTLQYYLSACCPCLLGMLYMVGDRPTDLMSAQLLSTWIPSNAKTSWNSIDIKKWSAVKFNSIDELVHKETAIENESKEYEPNLLLALAKVKKSKHESFVTRAAFVARGLPVMG